MIPCSRDMIKSLGNYSRIELKVNGDFRGALIAIEGNQDIPFDIKRMYYIFDTEQNVTRGSHAHRNLQQCLICVKGHCSVLIDDGNKKEVIALNKPNKGLLIKGLVWRELFDFSDDAVVVVLASDHYKNTEYIKTYAEFRDALG